MTRDELLNYKSDDRRLRQYREKHILENILVGVTPEQHKALLSIKARTRVPMSALVREAVDVVIRLYEKCA